MKKPEGVGPLKFLRISEAEVQRVVKMADILLPDNCIHQENRILPMSFLIDILKLLRSKKFGEIKSYQVCSLCAHYKICKFKIRG